MVMESETQLGNHQRPEVAIGIPNTPGRGIWRYPKKFFAEYRRPQN
jgi:hypothetical protein